jgi:hypothetical protein
LPRPASTTRTARIGARYSVDQSARSPFHPGHRPRALVTAQLHALRGVDRTSGGARSDPGVHERLIVLHGLALGLGVVGDAHRHVEACSST